MTYVPSALKPRYRRTNAELAEIDCAIYDIAAEERPVSVRGLYYRVMSRGLVPKTENGYSVVQRQALKMRRAGALPYGWITDGSRRMLKQRTYSSGQAALENTAQMYRRALWDDTGIHVEIWAEKDAITGVIYPVTNQFDVPLMVSRGFSSETFLWSTAEDINAEGNPVVIYQVGDHDPSGVAAWEDIQDKLRRFVNPSLDVLFERIAVTPSQIHHMNLPTRPTKLSDRRAVNFEGDSVEVDAIPTPELRQLVTDAIEKWIDPNRIRMLRIAEQSERQILQRMAGRWEDEMQNYAEGYIQ